MLEAENLAVNWVAENMNTSPALAARMVDEAQARNMSDMGRDRVRDMLNSI